MIKEGDNLYLQNSGNMDIVWVNLDHKFCRICEVDGYPNVYKWVNAHDGKDVFALHIKNNTLSDENVNIDIIKEY